MDYNENINKINENVPEPSQEERWAQFRSGSPGQGGPAGENGQPPKKKGHKGLIIFLIILAVAIALIIIIGTATKSAVKNSGLFGYNSYPEYDYDIDTDHLGLIDVEGEIGSSSSVYAPATYDQDWILEQIDNMEYTPANKGIILYLDTPGGGVYETDEVYLKLLEYKEATGNPVYAVMGPTCASGGYYLSCAADKIYANRNTTTGSIGVTFGTQFDLSGFLADHNIKTNTITSGANKAMGNMYEPMTDEQRAIFQSIIDEAYDQFTGIVAEGRKMDIGKVKQLADGRIYTAQQAKDAGLIDEVCSYNDAITAICEETGVSEDFVYEYQFYDNTPLFLRFFTALVPDKSLNSSDQDIAAVLKLAEQQELKPYYMMGR